MNPSQNKIKPKPEQDDLLYGIFMFRYGRLKICPKCGRNTKFYKLKKFKSYACKFCGYHLSPLSGTIFHKSSTPLGKWFNAFYLYKSTKGRIIIHDLRKELGVSLKTAWRIKKQIKTLFAEKKDPLYCYFKNWDI